MSRRFVGIASRSTFASVGPGTFSNTMSVSTTYPSDRRSANISGQAVGMLRTIRCHALNHARRARAPRPISLR